MDYAELFNFSDPEDAWLASPGDNPSNLSDALADFSSLNNLTGTNMSGARAGNSTYNLTAGRRAEPTYYVHSEIDSNLHILEIMKQTVYMIQERLLDLEPVVKKDEGDVRFRIAYVFNKIDEWVKDMRTIYYAMARDRYYKWRVKKHLYYYEHMLRKNIDVTYSVELLIHMHYEYMARMDEIMPPDERAELKELNKQKQGLNQSALDFLNKNKTHPKIRRRFARLPRL